MSSDMTINYGNTTTFSIWISPNQVRNQDKIRWTSSNTSVATIPSSCNGNLSCSPTIISDGNTIIKAVVVDSEEQETIIFDTATLTIKTNTMKLSSYITELYYEEGSKNANNLTSSTTLFSDSTADNNIRYTGASPKNYVWFNCDSDGTSCERWRIIGVMNNIYDDKELKETRVKLMRDESIGSYSWDTSSNDYNNGFGVNDWTATSNRNGNYGGDLMKLLNPTYEKNTDIDSTGTTIKVNNSLYWNRDGNSTTLCYSGLSNTTKNCNFSKDSDNPGLTEYSKLLFKQAKWYLAAMKDNSMLLWNQNPTLNEYVNERNIDSGLHAGNDQYSPLYWNGFVGLVYPSDYSFAGYYCTAGRDWYNSTGYIDKNDYTGCATSLWMFRGNAQWFITPYYSNVSSAIRSMTSAQQGPMPGYDSIEVRPSIYLKSNVVVKQDGADGSYDHPYNIALGS